MPFELINFVFESFSFHFSNCRCPLSIQAAITCRTNNNNKMPIERAYTVIQTATSTSIHTRHSFLEGYLIKKNNSPMNTQHLMHVNGSSHITRIAHQIYYLIRSQIIATNSIVHRLVIESNSIDPMPPVSQREALATELRPNSE